MDVPFGMQSVILKTTAAAAAVGVPGAFGAHADIPVLIGLWTNLTIRLAKKSGAEMDKAKAAKIAGGVISGVLTLQAGAKLATTYFAYTGIGTIPAIIVNASANGGLTYLFGRATAKVFLSNNLQDSVLDLVRGILMLMVGRVPSGLTDL